MVQEHARDESWLRSFEASVGGLSLVMPGNFLSAAGEKKKVSMEKAKTNIMTVFRLPGYFVRKSRPRKCSYTIITIVLAKEPCPSKFSYTR